MQESIRDSLQKPENPFSHVLMKRVVAHPHEIAVGKQQQITFAANGDIAEGDLGMILALRGRATIERIIRWKWQGHVGEGENTRRPFLLQGIMSDTVVSRQPELGFN